MVVERDFLPPGPYRLPLAGRDGLLRRRDGVLHRLLHHGDVPVTAHAWVAGGAVRIRTEGASSEACEYGIERMHFALGLDQDLCRVSRRLQARPADRPGDRASPLGAAPAQAGAVRGARLGDLRAADRRRERDPEIQRRLIHRFGRRSACGTLRDAPSPERLAGRAPAEIEACGLVAKRASALRRASREVAAGRADLHRSHEEAWRRLRAIPNIGSWTIECLAFHGQGRDDMLPALDLAYIKLVGRLAGLGRRAEEHEVRAFFAPYEPYAALAGLYALTGAMLGLTLKPWRT